MGLKLACRAAKVLTSVVLVGLVVGCATPVKEQPRANFISDYSLLEKEGEQAYTYTSTSLGSYNQFIVEPLQILFEQAEAEADRQFTEEEIDLLKAYFAEHLELALTRDGGYEVVSEPGPGVARLRHGLTALDTSTGVLNLTIFTKVTGAGLGGAAMESEVVDSVSGDLLGAAVQWGNGSRVLMAGITKFGDAKGQFKRWSRDLRARIDSAHGATSSEPGEQDAGSASE